MCYVGADAGLRLWDYSGVDIAVIVVKLVGVGSMDFSIDYSFVVGVCRNWIVCLAMEGITMVDDYHRISIRHDYLDEALRLYQQRTGEAHVSYSQVVLAAFRAFKAYDETAEFRAAFRKGDWE